MVKHRAAFSSGMPYIPTLVSGTLCFQSFLWKDFPHHDKAFVVKGGDLGNTKLFFRHNFKNGKVTSLEEGQFLVKYSLGRQNMSVTCWLGYWHLKTLFPRVKFSFYALYRVLLSKHSALCQPIPTCTIFIMHNSPISRLTTDSLTAPPCPMGDNSRPHPSYYIQWRHHGPLSQESQFSG